MDTQGRTAIAWQPPSLAVAQPPFQRCGKTLYSLLLLLQRALGASGTVSRLFNVNELLALAVIAPPAAAATAAALLCSAALPNLLPHKTRIFYPRLLRGISSARCAVWCAFCEARSTGHQGQHKSGVWKLAPYCYLKLIRRKLPGRYALERPPSPATPLTWHRPASTGLVWCTLAARCCVIGTLSFRFSPRSRSLLAGWGCCLPHC